MGEGELYQWLEQMRQKILSCIPRSQAMREELEATEKELYALEEQLLDYTQQGGVL